MKSRNLVKVSEEAARSGIAWTNTAVRAKKSKLVAFLHDIQIHRSAQ